MEKESLLQQVEQLVTHFGRESVAILEREEPMAGRSFAEWECACAARIVQWREALRLSSEELSLYGYITWSLNVLICEYRPCSDGNFADHLLRAMVVDYLDELASSYPNSHFHLKGLTDENQFEYDEPNHFYSISQTELLADLERLYAGSNARFAYWKERYPNANVLRDQMERDCARYREWIAHFERFDHCEVVRVNHLGEYENRDDWPSEMSMYVIDSGDRLWILTLSDYA